MKNKLIMPILMTILLIGTVLAMTGTETMTRTAPTSVNPGQSFQVSYTANGVSGSWGATVVDSISGGCTFSDGKTSKSFVMLSDLPNPLTYTIIAPSSGSCTFTGDYQFGEFPIKTFQSATVAITTSTCTPHTCTTLGKNCGSWSDGCSNTLNCGTCQTGYTCSSGTCIGDGGSGGNQTTTESFDFCGKVASKFDWFTILDDSCANGALILVGLCLTVVIIIGKL